MPLKRFLKGWLGELRGTLAQKLFLDHNVYHDINNITLPTKNGTTQIDHVIVSRYGIFVVESKNMKGWIYGDEKNPRWTQVIFGNKYIFQNPLRQNYRHTKTLSEFLNIPHNKFFSVIMFWGDCEFKTPMPENVLNQHYTPYIKTKTKIIFTDEQVQQIINAIKKGMLPKNHKTRQKHIQFLQQRFKHEIPTHCPECGGELIQRIAKTGRYAGKKFYGCSKYPDCHYIARES